METREFDSFHFNDLSDIAREQFLDRNTDHQFNVRGSNYMTDKKKEHPGNAVCKMMLLEVYEVDTNKDGERHDHIALRGLAKARREAIAALPGNPFQIIMNFQIPGDPPVSIVAFYAVPPSIWEDSEPDLIPFKKLLSKFIDMPATEEARLEAWTFDAEGRKVNTPHSEYDSMSEDGSTRSASPNPTAFSWMRMPVDITWPTGEEPGTLPAHDFRNARFKIIPSITDGPWVVKAAVRSQPCLLGLKVIQRYFRGDGYMEIDIHVGSSVIAKQIISVCRGYTTSCNADVGVVIQGEDPSELPERMLGCVSFQKVDLNHRQKLD